VALGVCTQFVFDGSLALSFAGGEADNVMLNAAQRSGSRIAQGRDAPAADIKLGTERDLLPTIGKA
jgi:hypothetical protein